MISVWISVPPKIDWTRLSPGAHNRGGEQHTGVPAGQGGFHRSARAAAFVRRDLARDHAPWDRLAAAQLPGPRRGPDDHAEPAAADVPAAGTDVDSGELIAAQLPQVLGVRCQRRPPGGVVLPRAAARQSVPQPGSGRSPRQHGHVRRSMTTMAGARADQAPDMRYQGSQDRTTDYPIHHFREREPCRRPSARRAISWLIFQAVRALRDPTEIPQVRDTTAIPT